MATSQPLLGPVRTETLLGTFLGRDFSETLMREQIECSALISRCIFVVINNVLLNLIAQTKIDLLLQTTI